MTLKLMIIGRRRPGSTLAEHRRHIRHVHGELVLRYIAEDPAHAPRRYVQNHVLPRPGALPVLDGIDEFWLDDERAAHTLLPQWPAAVNEQLVRPGYVTEGSAMALLAHEAVLHAGPST